MNIGDIAKLHSGTISDVLDAEGVFGVLNPAVRHLSGKAPPMFGRAYTICWAPTRKTSDIRSPQPSTWDQVKDFLAPKLTDGSGIVYVAGSTCGLITRMALAGGLSSTHFQNLGFSGMLLGGAVRDADTLANLSIPVYATNYTPADTQGAYQVVSAGDECMIDDVRIKTGDFIFADASGVVVIPDALVARVLERAQSMERTEEGMVAELRNGGNLNEIVRRSGRL